jgi:hypothetical protein
MGREVLVPHLGSVQSHFAVIQWIIALFTQVVKASACTAQERARF